MKVKIWLVLVNFCNLQVTKEPLSFIDVMEIIDNLKEHGILVGKGGIYGSVSMYMYIPSSSLFLSPLSLVLLPPPSLSPFPSFPSLIHPRSPLHHLPLLLSLFLLLPSLPPSLSLLSLQAFQIKPPLCFTERDAEYAISVMSGVLEEYEKARE